jgi:hypothetical protein
MLLPFTGTYVSRFAINLPHCSAPLLLAFWHKPNFTWVFVIV